MVWSARATPANQRAIVSILKVMGMVTQEQTAKAKIRALAQGVKVWVLEPGKRFVVPSCSQDGTAYEVVVQSTEPGGITCTCPGATHRGICKHIDMVMVRLEVDREMAQAQDKEQLERDLADLF
jgi:hypothetical protein